MIQNNLDIANTRIVSKFLPQPVCDARDNVADNEASTSPAGVIKLMPSQARFLATSASVGIRFHRPFRRQILPSYY